MDSPISKDNTGSGLSGVTVVVVTGLRESNSSREAREATPQPLFWESDGVLKAQIPAYNCINFSEGSSPILTDYLSPDFFDSKARNLLDFVLNTKRAEDGSNQLIFVGEDLGGIIVKKALSLAALDLTRYGGLMRDTCACVFYGVPQQAHTLDSWAEAITGVISFWRTLAQGRWRPRTPLLNFLRSTASDFVQVATRLKVISVFELGIEDESIPPTIDSTCATLDMSHELQIGRSVSLGNLARFHPDDKDGLEVVDALKRATEVTSQCREYTQRLARLSPFTRFPQHDSMEWIIDVLQPTLDCSPSSTIVLSGSHGIEKSILSYYVYKSLLRKCRSSGMIVTYFAFDSRDYRRRSITSMLSRIIHQILATAPDLFQPNFEPSQSDFLEWTEGNLWLWLRSLVHELKSGTLVLIIDFGHDCDTHDIREAIQDLFNLQFLRPGGFKLLCTNVGSIPHNVEPTITFDIDTLDRFRHSWNTVIARQIDTIISESPRFVNLRDLISGCILETKDFLHLSLIVHRIRTMTSLSRPRCIQTDLSLFGVDLKQTILGMVKGTPRWVMSAVSWMLFVRRPLKRLELAVAMALEESSSAPSQLQAMDELLIPQDIVGDIKRQLGPLVELESEEIHFSHPYAGKILQEWINSMPEDLSLNSKTLTRLCLEYLHMCLKRKTDQEIPIIATQIDFQFLDYVLENWPIHYRETMEDPATSNLSDDGDLSELAYSLFITPEYFSSLRPQVSLISGPPSEDDHIISPKHLAAQLGLLDIFRRLVPEPSIDDLMTLQIACQHGHSKIAAYIIEQINDGAKIEIELDRACLRGDAAVFNVLLKRLKKLEKKKLSSGNDALGYLLVNACKMGHAAIVKLLIDAGIDLKGACGSLALEQAVDQGHIKALDLLLKNGTDANALLSDQSSPLQRSILRGYSHISERLLSVEGIRDDPAMDGTTALHLAARSGKISLVEKIVCLPRPPLSKTGVSLPLHEAAAGGHLEVVKFLLGHDTADINSTDANGKTALFLALSNGQDKVVSELLSRDAVITLDREYSTSTLKQAIVRGNLDATKRLLDSGVDIDGDGRIESPLTDAAKGDFGEIIEVLLDAGADVNKRADFQQSFDILDEPATLGWTAVHFAAYYGNVNAMQTFIELRPASIATPTEAGHTALHLATFREELNVVEKMLQKRQNLPRDSTQLDIDPRTPEGRTPLHIAAAKCHHGLLRLLLEHCSNVNARDDWGRTPLHFAAAGSPGESEELVKLLLSRNADFDLPDNDGWTALTYAAQAGNERVVRRLLDKGSNPNATNGAINTPLDMAVLSNSEQIVEWLLKRGADPNKTDGESYSPLHVACYHGYEGVARLLLKAGANINTMDSQGNTPLHEAARRGQDDVVSMLLSIGADIDATCNRNMTPLQYSILNRSYSVAECLLRHGADPSVRDENGNTALMAALYVSADDELVTRLIDISADLNTMNNLHMTPLMQAVVSSPTHIGALLERKAEVLASGPDGVTALHMVASESAIDNIIPSLQNKEDINIKDAEGLAPIHHAAKRGDATMIKALRKYGARVSERDRQGRTIMHHAVRALSFSEFKGIFTEFLRPGLMNKVNVPDGDDWTPLHWACKGAEANIVKLLLSKYDQKQVYAKCRHGWSPYSIAVFHEQKGLQEIIKDFMNRHTTATGLARKRENDRIALGTIHEYVQCDDCLYMPIYGIRYKCTTHPDFDLCFKCRWNADKTHETGHKFDIIGRGPTESPIPEISNPEPIHGSGRGGADPSGYGESFTNIYPRERERSRRSRRIRSRHNPQIHASSTYTEDSIGTSSEQIEVAPELRTI